MLGTIRAFWNDQRGVAMILVAIMLPALIGLSLLAIDMSRASSLHQQLQKGVDALAMATAAELDGRADSIDRANRAKTTLLSNTTKFSKLGNNYKLADADVTVTYLTGIPASDSTGLTAAGVDADGVNWASTDPKAVSFSLVTVNPSVLAADGAGAFEAIFPASFGGGNNTFDIRPQAVAGFVQSICETVPIFMCNPFETTDPSTSKTIQQAFASGDTYSREFRILKVDNNPGPGNFGLIDNNLSSLRDAIAMGTSGTCYDRAALTTKTGVTLGQVNAGLNTRFDLYSGSLNKNNKDWAYRPASNIRKGQKTGCSKYDPVTDNSALPLPPGDSYGVAKPGMSLPIGLQGFWTNYWQINHGGAYPNVPSATNPTGTKTAPASRYDVYKYEIANGRVADKSLAPTKETGVPSCYKGDTPTVDPDRRLLNMAIVNCIANKDKINGHVKLRPDGYASVFVNTPVAKQDNTKDPEDPSAAEKPISLEIVDVDGHFADNTLVDKAFRNEAQLYR
jgi:Flp pilus assembly protein TadG